MAANGICRTACLRSQATKDAGVVPVFTIGRSDSSALAGGGDFRGRGARMGEEPRYVLNSVMELLAEEGASGWESNLECNDHGRCFRPI